jgi:hypothetical protein
MKKCLLVLTVVALSLALATPAMALKLTTKGRMDVTGIYLSSDVFDADDDTDANSNAWYQMELVVDPVLHVNDKVRIHARFTVLERVWTGGDTLANTAGAAGFPHPDYRGDIAGGNDFWWEQLYLSFPLMGGTLYVGRMSGGSWDTWFQDTADNRDRIKYVRKFGHVVVLGLIEKLSEQDGGAPLGYPGLVNVGITGFPGAAGTAPVDIAEQDIDAYAIGAIIPFSKAFVWKPLLYLVNYEGGSVAAIYANGWDILVMNGFHFTTGNFALDAEINYRSRDWPGVGAVADWDEDQWSGWVQGKLTFGPASLALAVWYLEGTDAGDPNSKSLWGTGGEWQPMLLSFSEDMGVLWNTAGVFNGTAGASGYWGAWLRGDYKLTDAMKMWAILGYLEADEMPIPGVDDELGWEFNVGFEWAFMPNIKYVVEGGYMAVGGYSEDIGDLIGVDENDVWGIRHMLVINW